MKLGYLSWYNRGGRKFRNGITWVRWYRNKRSSLGGFGLWWQRRDAPDGFYEVPYEPYVPIPIPVVRLYVLLPERWSRRKNDYEYV